MRILILALILSWFPSAQAENLTLTATVDLQAAPQRGEFLLLSGGNIFRAEAKWLAPEGRHYQFYANLPVPSVAIPVVAVLWLDAEQSLTAAKILDSYDILVARQTAAELRKAIKQINADMLNNEAAIRSKNNELERLKKDAEVIGHFAELAEATRHKNELSSALQILKSENDLKQELLKPGVETELTPAEESQLSALEAELAAAPESAPPAAAIDPQIIVLQKELEDLRAQRRSLEDRINAQEVNGL